MDLQLQELSTCLRPKDLMNKLQSLPRDLEDAYEAILLRCSKPEELKTLLEWLAFSIRPLSLSELADALAVDFSLDEIPAYDPDLRYMDARDILTVCSGFVSVYKGGSQIPSLYPFAV